MNDINKPFNYVGEQQRTIPIAKTFMSGVFMWMFLAMGITAATAWLFATTPSLISLLYNPETDEFYGDIGIEARDQDKKWLPIIKDLSLNIPDKSFIYLTPDAGC